MHNCFFFLLFSFIFSLGIPDLYIRVVRMTCFYFQSLQRYDQHSVLLLGEKCNLIYKYHLASNLDRVGPGLLILQLKLVIEIRSWNISVADY